MQGLLWEDLPSRLPALLPEPLRRAGTRLPCAHADLLCCGEGLVYSPFYALFLVFWPVSVESLFAVCHYTRACNERGENVDLGEHLRWHPDWLARFRHIRTPPPPACAIRHPSEPELLTKLLCWHCSVCQEHKFMRSKYHEASNAGPAVFQE